ncbi:MAG TPA: DNA polymerase III subunit delta [Thermoflexia bacterium]|nr:DNA polymerase III subunit delta [Thermoflexia bacterium]
MFYIIHGDNLLEQQEYLGQLQAAQAAKEEFADLNNETLSAPLSLGKLQHACDTLPFLGGHRLITVKNALAESNKSWLKEAAAYLPGLPDSTVLVFVEQRALPKSNPVLKLAQQQGSSARIKLYMLPRQKALSGWIRERAQKLGSCIEPAAAALLARNIGVQLQQLDQELHKLKLYHGESGAITLAEVRLLVPYVQSADVIFDLVDALGQRNPRIAARHLHRLLDTNEPPLRIFGMIVRQYRLLIQVRWLMQHQHPAVEIAKRLKLHPYVTKKTYQQATLFTHAQLLQAYEILRESDRAIKTGKLSAETALDLLVARLTAL